MSKTNQESYTVTVSIVVYKTCKHLLNRVLSSVLRESVRKHVTIVDNSPSDILRTYVESLPDIRYIFTGKNLGYGAGHNIAIRSYTEKAKYHLVLNPDVYFEHGVLDMLVDYMDRFDNVGHIMPRVEYPNGDMQYLCKLLPRPVDVFVRRFVPISFLRNRLNRKYELRFADSTRVMDVPYLSGCFMLLRIKALQQVGLFDERFFMYPEDIDLTRRMHRHYRTVYYPKVSIIHDHERESYRSLKMLLIHVRNLVKYFNKWGWIFDPERKAVNKATIDRLLKSV